MQLTSFTFLFAFLPVSLLFLLLLRKRLPGQNAALLILSVLFCAASGLAGFLAGLLETLAVYALALILARADRPKARKMVFTLGVLFCAGLLCYFKYTNFLLGALSLPTVSLLPAPLGVSFLTFLLISYLADMYRGRIPVERRFDRFLLYAFFFPKAAQGPLCRYGEFSAQLDARAVTADNLNAGVTRLIFGLGKKALLSSAAGAIAQEAFSLPASALTPVYAWTGAICYALQIYFDFSGYTDLALGLALLFGFTLPENFNHPYMADSVTDFWRRWHMSLSSWFRAYVYIPLGGSRCSKGRLVWNLFAVWSLTGLWHGANWTFVCWGLWFFVLLSLEKLVWGQALARLPGIVRHAYALLAVFIGWIFFRSSSLSYAFSFLRALFVPGMGAPDALSWLTLCIRQYGLQLVICLLLSTNLGTKAWNALARTKPGRAVRLLFLLLVLGLSVLSMAGSGMQAFIYAQF